jgi:hypothetical protein
MFLFRESKMTVRIPSEGKEDLQTKLRETSYVHQQTATKAMVQKDL